MASLGILAICWLCCPSGPDTFTQCDGILQLSCYVKTRTDPHRASKLMEIDLQLFLLILISDPIKLNAPLGHHYLLLDLITPCLLFSTVFPQHNVYKRGVTKFRRWIYSEKKKHSWKTFLSWEEADRMAPWAGPGLGFKWPLSPFFLTVKSCITQNTCGNWPNTLRANSCCFLERHSRHTDSVTSTSNLVSLTGKRPEPFFPKVLFRRYTMSNNVR